jgi:hypothetical protein
MITTLPQLSRIFCWARLNIGDYGTSSLNDVTQAILRRRCTSCSFFARCDGIEFECVCCALKSHGFQNHPFGIRLVLFGRHLLCQGCTALGESWFSDVVLSLWSYIRVSLISICTTGFIFPYPIRGDGGSHLMRNRETTILTDERVFIFAAFESSMEAETVRLIVVIDGTLSKMTDCDHLQICTSSFSGSPSLIRLCFMPWMIMIMFENRNFVPEWSSCSTNYSIRLTNNSIVGHIFSTGWPWLLRQLHVS